MYDGNEDTSGLHVCMRPYACTIVAPIDAVVADDIDFTRHVARRPIDFLLVKNDGRECNVLHTRACLIGYGYDSEEFTCTDNDRVHSDSELDELCTYFYQDMVHDHAYASESSSVYQISFRPFSDRRGDRPRSACPQHVSRQPGHDVHGGAVVGRRRRRRLSTRIPTAEE